LSNFDSTYSGFRRLWFDVTLLVKHKSPQPLAVIFDVLVDKIPLNIS